LFAGQQIDQNEYIYKSKNKIISIRNAKKSDEHIGTRFKQYNKKENSDKKILIMNSLIRISIVSPVYKAENLISKLVTEIIKYVQEITPHYEIILVEDGSPDKSWEGIREICKKKPEVKGVKLSRNFGQHYAITAGLTQAKGEWIVVMDCDLQDLPEEIPRLFEKAMEGYDLVVAKRTLRKDTLLKKLSSKLFYSIFSYLTETKQDNTIANFGIYNAKVIQAILSMNDHIRYFPTMSQWVGFSKGSLNVKHGAREEGESSYSWKKLINLALENIIAFSDKPLRLTIRFGLLMSCTSSLVGIYYLFQYFTGKIVVLGFISVIVSIWFLAGIIILILGILGIYVGKMFEKIKDRPVFIIQDKINFDE